MELLELKPEPKPKTLEQSRAALRERLLAELKANRVKDEGNRSEE